MKKLLRPALLIPFAVASITVGIVFSHGSAASAASKETPPTTAVQLTDPNAAGVSVGSGSNNLYSRQGNGVPDVSNPGQYLYVQGCSTCHGLQGEGTQVSENLKAPSLIGVGAADVDFWVSTGRMPLNQPVVQAPRKTPIYNRAQIDQLISYVTSLTPTAVKQGPAIPAVNPDAGNLVEGNQLFANNCAACHNSQGSGGAVGRNYYAPAVYQATPTQVGEAIRVGPGSMPIFGPKTFSDEQVNSLVKYVTTLKDQNNRGGIGFGAIGPVSEGFIGWMLGLVLLLVLTRWIGTRV